MSQFVGVFSCVAFAAELGANKMDLLLQYTNPTIPAGSNAAGYRRVRIAMARKAIADAHDAGFTFLRVSADGFRPATFDDKQNDLALWQTNPAAFWADVDLMFDDLDRAHIRLVPTLMWSITQFPSLGKDDVATFVRNPRSPSRQLLAQFIQDFISRYKNRKTILFYELTSEMNLDADVNLQTKCNNATSPCVWTNFTTSEMLAFSRDLVAVIKSVDPVTPITSGYALPRPAATHLAIQPAFSSRGADWTLDTPEAFRQHLIAIHQPFDIISVHIYPNKYNNRFGRPEGEQYKMVNDSAAAAKVAGKSLFIGEFGDTGGLGPFVTDVEDEIVRDNVAYTSIWVWEFYQKSTYQTYNTEPTQYNIEPGYSDKLIASLKNTEISLGGSPPSPVINIPPRVVLTWPLPCAAIDKPIDIAAVASDGAHAVKSVEFLVDGKILSSVSAPPYLAHFDPAGLGKKNVEIEARAVSLSGATAEFESAVGVNGSSPSCATAN